ncbi:MAG TPA: SDR family oxidoreductase [Anaerolineales bacterium]|nr:SDR family oxidoreductase [Anaerolineales bacterium]
MSLLAGKVVVVVGGGGGLGRVIGATLASGGARIVLAGRSPDKLESAALEVSAAGGHVLTVVVDASDEQGVRALADRARATFGEVDILVNCAGLARPGSVGNYPWDDWQRMQAANLDTVFLTVREFIPRMMQRGRGSIVNIASRAGLYAPARAAVYASAKAGVIAFTRALNGEARARGVQVVAVAPGPMDTPLRWAATPDFDPAKVIPPRTIADLVFFIVTHPDITFEDPVVPMSINH